MKGYGRTQKDNEQLGKQVPDTVGDCWVREGTGLGNRVKERDELKVTESGVVILWLQEPLSRIISSHRLRTGSSEKS